MSRSKKVVSVLLPFSLRSSNSYSYSNHNGVELTFLWTLGVKGLNFGFSAICGRNMFKVNNRNTGTRCEICSKLTIKTPERRQRQRSGVFTVNFEHISHLVLVFLLISSSRQMPAGPLFDLLSTQFIPEIEKKGHPLFPTNPPLKIKVVSSPL